MTTVVSFRSGGQDWAVALERVQRVLGARGLLALPDPRPGVAGLLHRDGSTVTVVSPLGAGRGQVLVLDGDGTSIGLLVDEVVGIERVPQEAAAPPRRPAVAAGRRRARRDQAAAAARRGRPQRMAGLVTVAPGGGPAHPPAVVVAEDSLVIRAVLVEQLLSRGYRVIEAGDGEQALAACHRERPDVVLLDVEMPVMGAKQAMEIMLENSPPPRVVIVTMHDDPRLVRELIGLGAVAYLVKSATIEELHTAVHTAAKSPIGPDKDVVIVAPPKAFRKPAEGDGLSERELEVLLMVARGMSNNQIAVSLHLSEATVKRHLANISQDRGLFPR